MQENQNASDDAQQEQIVYERGQLVSYGSFGVCEVIDRDNYALHGNDEDEETYYKLRPIHDNRCTYYVPLNRAPERLRPLLTKEQIYQLIDEEMATDNKTEEWCTDSRKRRENFHDILHGDDYPAMIHMLQSLHLQRDRKRAAKRRLSSADEASMLEAEFRMYQEFCIVLGIPSNEVHRFIVERLGGTLTESENEADMNYNENLTTPDLDFDEDIDEDFTDSFDNTFDPDFDTLNETDDYLF